MLIRHEAFGDSHHAYHAPALGGVDGLLNKYLEKVWHAIEEDGITSLHWVAGVKTSVVANGLVSVLGRHVAKSNSAPAGGRVVLVQQREALLTEQLASKFGFEVLSLKTETVSDSFLILNNTLALDLTPLSDDEGTPELAADPVVVELYRNLFGEMAQG
ncbi:MAG: hypothetical protein FJ317_04170 [SAR202 cluster bacterium]|nr:hypothetical protein [SAR202 cluster bacterium]